VYVSFYVEAANRDAFMAVKQDLLLAFIDCVERNGAKLAKQLLQARALRRPGRSRSSVPAAGPRRRGPRARALPVVAQAAVRFIGLGLRLPTRTARAQVEVVAQALPAGRGAAAAAGAGAPADAPPGGPGAPLLTLPEGRGQQGRWPGRRAGRGRAGRPGPGRRGRQGRAARRPHARAAARAGASRSVSSVHMRHECQHAVASRSGSASAVVDMGGLAAASPKWPVTSSHADGLDKQCSRWC